ncbi:DUF2155 domain-containing protein [Tropicimonas sediminicola]|uniref:DUF2155 domain-containing protein n=1 Tax=Tropicimonas sediminicola TaxID=1031541 RepID=A0A239FF52_9RHOB|nr:DUF2155 domain-containing protein [Tropicimonas sediminicola]SNS55427.1 hypothetical protein SAMN05421757_102641 [Tropicimonas sediminicola]
MRWLAIALLAAAPAFAQQEARSASGGEIRLLDKINGETTDISIGRGETKLFGRLSITLGDCRYPASNPNSDAFGWLEIRDVTSGDPAFSGWMIASSPALKAMDHPRYDVWLLRCSND